MTRCRAPFALGIRAVGRWLILLGWFVLQGEAWAHKTSDSYLRLAIDGPVVRGEWALALHDLEFAVGLDTNGDGAITWGELKSHRDGVLDYARGRIGVELDGHRIDLRMDPELQVDHLANGGYAVLRFEGHSAGAAPGVMDLEYRVFFDIDRLHRGLVQVEAEGG